MRSIFLVTLLGVACVLSSALPVRDEDETSEELLQGHSDEKLLSVLQSALEVSEQQQDSSSSRDVSEPSSNDVDTDRSSSSGEEQRRKRLVANLQINDESDSYSREIDDKTIIKRSVDLREKRKAGFDFIGTRTAKRFESEESSEEEDPLERVRRSLEPVNVDSDSDESHPRHDELRLKHKRGAKDSSSGEDSAQKKDKDTSEDSSEEKDKKDKKKPAQLQTLGAEEKPKDEEEVQALRRKRQVPQPNSSEAKSSGEKGLSEELTDLETADDIVQKETQDEVENSEETIVDTGADDDNEAALLKSIEDKKQDVNSVEDYVQGCEVMEPDSNEANETTYITDKR